MAISIVNVEVEGGGPFSGLSFDENAGASENDIMLVAVVRGFNTNDGSWSAPADFNLLALKEETAGNNDCQFAIYWKRRGTGIGDGYDFTYSGTPAGCSGAMFCIRGVDTTDAFDVAYVEGSHYASNVDAVETAAQPITTVTDGALVLLIQNFTQELDSAAPPSGYTLQVAEPEITAGGSRHLYIVSKVVATAGTETPAAYGHVDSDDDSDGRTFTIALRPAAGSAPAEFDSAPAVDSVTDTGYVIAYDANASADTIYAVALPPGSAAPSAADVQAGTGAHGTASEACTGAADTLSLTVTDDPPFPKYDLYFVLESDAVLSDVASLTNEPLDATAGWQFRTVNVPWPAAAESILDGASPAAVDGDVIRAEATVHPGEYDLVMDADGTFWFMPGSDDGRQYFDAQLYDLSLGEYTDTARFYVNDVPPVFGGETTRLIPVDEDVGTSLPIADEWVDAEDDALTVEWLDSLPDGLADDSGSLSGTPTVQGTFVITSQATDVAGEVSTQDIDIVVGPRLPDVVGVEDALAVSGLLLSGPSLSIAYEESVYSDTIAENAVITMVPPSGTVVEPDATVTLLLSLGEEPTTPEEPPEEEPEEEEEVEFDGWHRAPDASGEWTPV